MQFQPFGKFSEIEFKRIDFIKMKKDLVNATKEFKNAKDFQAADDALMKMEQLRRDQMTNGCLCQIRQHINTADKFYEEEMQYFYKNIALLTGATKKVYQAILSTPFKKEFSDKYGEIFFKQLEADNKVTSVKNMFLEMKESKLTMEYSKLIATQSCEFQGQKCNFYGLLKFMENEDRQLRKQAMQAWAIMYENISEKLNDIYQELITIRSKMAKRLGFKDYIDMIYLVRHRFDYNEKDVAAFREQILTVVTPLAEKLAKRQAERLGVEKLHYYDEKILFPDGNANPIGTPDELIAKAQKMYHEMSYESGEFFDFMVEHEVYDLVTKPNKHMGGYCSVLPNYGTPFIYSNFNGTGADHRVLTHEAGHCFNFYLSMRNNQLTETVDATMEVCEIHSIAMEHFTFPWAKEFFGEGADKAKYLLIAERLMGLPYMAAVDEFQHEVFHNPKMTSEGRLETWKKIEKKYMPWRDYDGNEFLANGGFWMQKQHIYLYPFYYIDYALAQISAYEFYGKDKADHKSAWKDYVELCKAGGNDTYLNLLKKANLANPFTKGTVEKAVANVLPDIEKVK